MISKISTRRRCGPKNFVKQAEAALNESLDDKVNTMYNELEEELKSDIESQVDTAVADLDFQGDVKRYLERNPVDIGDDVSDYLDQNLKGEVETCLEGFDIPTKDDIADAVRDELKDFSRDHEDVHSRESDEIAYSIKEAIREFVKTDEFKQAVLDAVRVRIVSSDVKADISTSPLESVFEYGMSLVEYGRALVAPKDTPFNVVLTGCDGKIAAIKAIREAMGYGLKEAKDMVEGIPSVFAARVSKDQAWNIKNILVRGGCLVSIRESK